MTPRKYRQDCSDQYHLSKDRTFSTFVSGVSRQSVINCHIYRLMQNIELQTKLTLPKNELFMPFLT